MSKLKGRLSALAKALGLQTALLQRARRRYRAFHKRAYKAMEQKQAAQAAADQARAAGHLALAARKDKKALKLEAVELRQRTRKQFWLGRVKVLVQRVEGLEADHAKVAAEIKREFKVSVRKNKVTGGTPRQRIRVALHTAAANCRKGTQNNYYSMTGGARDYLHALVGYALGRIWDCSTFGDGIYLCCGLEAPSGPRTLEIGGYTGTMGEHGKQVAEADARTGDLVLYGPFPHHHVEVVDEPKAKTTIGHGSAPIDQGVFDLFGDSDYIVRSYIS